MSKRGSPNEKRLLDLLAESDILTDQLYHLQNSHSILNYKPSSENVLLNKDSESFQIYKSDNNLDLWPQPGRRQTRKVSSDKKDNIAELKEKLLKAVDSQILDKLAGNSSSQPKFKRKHDIESSAGLADGKSKKFKPLVENIPSKLPKLKFKISVKPQQITHPDHLPVHEFDSTDELFKSYRNVIEDPAPEIEAEAFEEYIQSQTELVNNIKNAIHDKQLLYIDYNENPFRSVPNGVREPTMIKRNPNYHMNNYRPSENPFRLRNELTHHDHLLAQGLKSSKLIHDGRVNKIQKCKRISQMIEIHFKRLSQEKEKQEKDFQRKIHRLARDTAKEVKKKWTVALKAYRVLEEREKERDRAMKSKEQLSKILDHSTKVLGAQMLPKSSNNNSSIEPGDRSDSKSVNGDDDDDVADDDDDDDDDDDEMLSSSSSEEELESADKAQVEETSNTPLNGIHDEEDDSKLTDEQLREKYKLLNRVEQNTIGRPETVDTFTESEKIQLLAENDDPLLEENTDTSSGSSSDSSLTDSDSSSGEEDDDEQSSNVGLSSLLRPSTHVDDGGDEERFGSDADDESVYSEFPDAETPSSSPEHINEVAEETDEDGIPNVPIPVLLKGKLRPYQKQGLNWLASLYNNGTNGILADEMGLGKTIQTISLLSYLACEKNVWGPHLIVVPTSVMLNWEMEFKRFAPGFKVLTYYGSPQQRKEKRKGWNTPDTFHVCITSYQLVVHDQPIFRRKKWKYMILDEAHNIKNFKSQRWKALLNFNTENRLLLTGTPLQNNIMELWSLLYFLMPTSKEGQVSMPEGFADLMDFQQWFGKPVDKIIQQGGKDNETKETVNKLHQVLRPYLLRRLKQDVEKQMPAKHEHVVYCRLSKRQRLLYDDFMSRAQTKETLASGNFLSIINCLMQLRKVCNHPDLFEVRPILTSFSEQKSVMTNYEMKNHLIKKLLRTDGQSKVNLEFLNLVGALTRFHLVNSYDLDTIGRLNASSIFDETITDLKTKLKGKSTTPSFDDLQLYYEFLLNRENQNLLEFMEFRKYVNDFACTKSTFISAGLTDILSFKRSKAHVQQLSSLGLIRTLSERCEDMHDIIERYAFVTPKAVCNNITELAFPADLRTELLYDSQNNIIANPLHQVQVKSSIAFPDKSLLQYDCGKLQKLSNLLHELIPKGHRVLIFTQMSKVLDILELFLNFNGYTYMRLDGATKIEDRQLLTERFNNDSRVKCFILSTRAGGLGINLTGADTVIFYDSDWNPAIDKQCQDRCHRIGQTRDVHIYRFVSEYTIEANILKKAEQKKYLDNVVIQEGDFTTDYFSKVTVQELLGNVDGKEKDTQTLVQSNMKSRDFTKALEMAEDAEDAKAAEIAMKEDDVDVEDFSDDDKPHAPTSSEQNTRESSVADVEEVQALAGRIAKREAHINNVPHTEGVETESGEDDYDDDDIGHIDEYMIRFIAGGYYPE